MTLAINKKIEDNFDLSCSINQVIVSLCSSVISHVCYSHGGYLNRPLVPGSSYKVWYGAGDEVDGVAKFEYVLLPQRVVGEFLRLLQ